MQNLVTDELTIRVDLSSAGRIRLLMVGKSASRQPGELLTPFFGQALVSAAQSRSTLEVHFEKLSHFNSSTIAVVIQFINAAQQRRVPIMIQYDGSLKWQALSFEALQRAVKPFVGTEGSSVNFVEWRPK
jgi:hypothetical protein